MTDYQTKQKRRNMIVGVFVIFSLCVFVWMLFRFRELPLVVSKLKSFNVLVYFPEAPGVQPDTPVQYCGYQIGRVMKVSRPQLYGNSHRVGVTLAIEKQYVDIPEEADIFVMKRGLGSSFVELRVDPSKITRPDKFLRHEIEINTGKVGMASDFFPPEVQAKLEDLVESITALTENANAIIGDGENQTNIKRMITSIETAFSQADETMKSIQQLSDASAEKVQILGDNLIGAAEQLEGVLSESRQILAKLDSSEGTAGKMINDGRLYEDLLESSQELRMLLEQVKEWAAETREEGLRIQL
jgi:phospholipid/cholesterol/gamma-HCH transport system substrate-binding protein